MNLETRWRNASGEYLPLKHIIDLINLAMIEDDNHQVTIGVDSQPKSNYSIIVKVIAVIFNDKRHYYWVRSRTSNIPNDLRSRMLEECNISINLATMLTNRFVDPPNLSIHLDVNTSDSKAATSKFSSMLENIVRAYGFDDVEVKPNSWAASSVADKYTKVKQ